MKLEQLIVCTHGFPKRERGHGKKRARKSSAAVHEEDADVCEEDEVEESESEEEAPPELVKGQPRKRKFANRHHTTYRHLGELLLLDF